MIDGGRGNVLGIPVQAIDYEAAVRRVIGAARQSRPMAVSALAVHGVMTGVFDPVHRFRLNRFDLLVPDGQPVRWVLNWFNRARLPDRVYGPKLMIELCREAAACGLPIFLYGSTADVLAALTENLTAKFPSLQVAGTQPSRFRRLSPEEADKVAETIRGSGARMVFVGLGCPRQEVWAYEYRDRLNMPIVAVGAAFPFHAGKLAQAPPILQKRGLEWFYRFCHEPRRLWKRYLLLNPAFCALAAAQLLRFHDWSRSREVCPEEESRFG
jgi:N-acetylglucosaminyldiphosphoundecaprenol N-acetyl-beta-D-mannosaminyltransferase